MAFNIFQVFRNKALAGAQAVKRTVLSWAIGVSEVWPDWNARTSLETTYGTITAIFSIVNRDAAKFGYIKRYLYDAESIETGRALKAAGLKYKDIAQLLKKPNPHQTQSEFFEAARIMYMLTGEVYVWLNRGDRNMAVNDVGELVQRSDKEMDRLPVLEMYVLPSGFVGIIPDPRNVFEAFGYWLEIGGDRKPIRKGDMIHWKRYNPLFNASTGEHLHGLSPTKAGRCTIQEHKDITASSDRMFKNDGAKGFVVNSDLDWESLTEVQKNDILSTIQNRINNNDLKGAVGMLLGKWDYKEIGKSSVDLDLLAAKRFSWQELCFLFGVPFEFFDTNAKYNNSADRQRQWVTNTIAPACSTFDEKLTERLALAFGLENKAVILSDFSALPEMQKNIGEMAQAFNVAWYMTPNQKLLAMGYDPSPNKLFDEPWIPDGITPISRIETNFENADGQTKLDEQGLEY